MAPLCTQTFMVLCGSQDLETETGVNEMATLHHQQRADPSGIQHLGSSIGVRNGWLFLAVHHISETGLTALGEGLSRPW